LVKTCYLIIYYATNGVVERTMMQRLFSDNLRVKMYTGKSRAGVDGIYIVPTCPECGQEVKVHMPWAEVKVLLEGKQVMGISKLKAGTFGYPVPSHGLPQGGACMGVRGQPTQIPVRFTFTELRNKWRDAFGQ
jgi:hypothetical protein